MKLGWLGLSTLLAAFVLPAQASFHLFRIVEVYSNADGSLQYIMLHESTGSNGENLWSGQTLETINAAGQKKQYRFASNLPSSSTANRSVLVATSGFATLGVPPDYTIPDRFVPTDGGKVDFAGVDEVTLSLLPVDGATAVGRNRLPVTPAPRNFANATATVAASPVTSVEFYNASLDHYFTSALAPDIDALDSGRISGWARTGLAFKVHPSSASGGSGVNPVCRILIPPPANSHFFSASPQECSDTITKYPFMTQETAAAFYIALPATDGPNAGGCPPANIAVYRVFNNRADGNHRYTVDRSVRDAMVASGGIAEGYGNDAVIMCAPPSAASTPVSTPPMDEPPPVDYPPGDGYGPP